MKELPALQVHGAFTLASPPPTSIKIIPSGQRIRGKIRVVAEKDGSPLGYLSQTVNDLGLYAASRNAEEALVVSLVLSSKPTELYIEVSIMLSSEQMSKLTEFSRAFRFPFPKQCLVQPWMQCTGRRKKLYATTYTRETSR